MGDYWGACVMRGLREVRRRASPGATIAVPGPVDAARLGLSSLAENRYLGDPVYSTYRVVENPPASGPYWGLYINRLGFNALMLAQEAGRSRLVWRDVMPPGNPACVLVERPSP
jgi:hypothetical protein